MATNETLPAAAPAPREYRGNWTDIVGLLAAMLGMAAVAPCFMGGLFSCLPLILGAVGLLSAKDAVDPRRTRILSWTGIGLSAIVYVLIALFVFCYFAFVLLAVLTSSGARRPAT